MHVAPGFQKSWIIDGHGYDKLWSAHACQCLSFTLSLPCSYLSRCFLGVFSSYIWIHSKQAKYLDLIVLWLPEQRARMCSYEGGRGSSVTKLADEACDLFKGMPKSQHQNKL